MTWTLPYASFIPQEQLDRVATLVGQDAFLHMDWREKLILAMMPENQFVGNKEIRQLIPTHAADMTKYLTGLASKGYLETSGRSSATRYRLRTGQELAEDATPASAPLSPFERLAREFKLSDEEIAMLKEYRTCKRNAPHVTDEVILTVCKGRWMTMAQLAILMDRNPKSLWNKAVQALVRHAKMNRRHEGSTHSEQAYTTASE